MLFGSRITTHFDYVLILLILPLVFTSLYLLSETSQTLLIRQSSYAFLGIFIFLFIFFAMILVNYMVVPYQYYVFIEGIQALVGIIVPCLCVSNNLFNLNIFIEKWWRFSRLNLPLVLVAIILFKQGLVHYSIFTSICVPNVFIGSYMVLQGIEKKKWLYVNVAFNILVTAVLGGRMSAAISACMILFAYVYVHIHIHIVILIACSVWILL